MDLSFTKEDLAFQQEVRAWIADAYTPELRRRNAMSKNGYIDKEGMVEWQQKLDQKGWFVANWPEEFGGPTLSATERYILNMEMSAAGTPTTSPMGKSMVAPVIMAFGNDEQKAEHLPSIKASTVWWCQGYSEPGAGSDLASLQMSAVRDGDDYVLNGSKIWTTQAQFADMIFCLVRTSKEGKPQQGISFIVFPMNLPGITVSSLPTLDGPVDGEQEINQVYFENVRVPIKESLIGEENKGWTYAKYLLQFERGNAYAPGLRNALAKTKKIAALEQADGEALTHDPDFARKMALMEIKIDSIDATERRIFSALSAGQALGPESSMLKCVGSETQQEISALALEATGGYCAPFVRDTFAIAREGNNAELPTPDYALPVAPSYLNYRKASIYAGSNEIQRNIMSKMILAL
jgi:alkylation response protein AidB-like acyl-CoA dehydrogenase